MDVLLTGIGGFAGGHLAEFLVGRGWTVNGLMRSPNSRTLDLPADRFRIIVADAVTLTAIPDNLDAVIHAAATMPFVGASPQKLRHDNVDATTRLVELARKHKARSFVFFSSTSVFGREHTGVLSDTSAPIDPEEYGETKIICEKMLRTVVGSLPSVSFRTPAIIGAGAGGNWIASVAARIDVGNEIAIFNSGASFNNCVHIADIAALIVGLIERGISGCEAAILAADGFVTIREAVDILMRCLGRTVPVREVAPTRKTFTVSSERARQIWNWRPMTTAESLERYAKEQRAFAQNLGRSSPQRSGGR